MPTEGFSKVVPKSPMHQFSGNKGEFLFLFGVFGLWVLAGKSHQSLEDEIRPKLVSTNGYTEIKAGSKELSKWI